MFSNNISSTDNSVKSSAKNSSIITNENSKMLSWMKNSELDLKIKALARKERELLGELLEHLKEADSRRLYLDFGYSSLFSYLVESCGYSAGAAQRRIDAARLFKVEPKLKEKIESGEINLAQTTILQKALREKNKTEPVSLQDKRDLISRLGHKSTSETQFLIAKELNLEVKEQSKQIYQKDESVRLEITLTKEQWQKLEKARDLTSNATQSNDWATVLEYFSDRMIKQKEGSGARRERKESSAQTLANRKKTSKRNDVDATMAVIKPISQKIRKSILCRDQVCQHKDLRTGKICASRWNLHIDHIQPRWAGGPHDEANLRVLCAKHNQHVYKRQARIEIISG